MSSTHEVGVELRVDGFSLFLGHLELGDDLVILDLEISNGLLEVVASVVAIRENRVDMGLFALRPLLDNLPALPCLERPAETTIWPLEKLGDRLRVSTGVRLERFDRGQSALWWRFCRSVWTLRRIRRHRSTKKRSSSS